MPASLSYKRKTSPLRQAEKCTCALQPEVLCGRMALCLLFTILFAGCETKASKPLADKSPPIAVQPIEPKEVTLPDEIAAENDSASKAATEFSADEVVATPGEKAAVAEREWEVLRVIALHELGPSLIDIRVAVGTHNPSQYATQVMDTIADELLAENDELPWEDFLENPVVKSGWLGNLVANDEQVAQVAGMYDADKDGIVDRNELPAFLTRGLSRGQAIEIVDAGLEATAGSSASPWGKMDTNQNNVLDADEMQQAQQQLMRLDFNGDRIVSKDEISEVQTQAAMGGMATSMIRTSTLLMVPSQTDAEKTAKTALRSVSQKILQHTTFLASVEKGTWSGWSDALWGRVDSNHDNQVDRDEIAAMLLDELPQARVDVILGIDAQVASSVVTYASTANEAAESRSDAHWFGDTVALLVRLEDSFNERSKAVLRAQLQTALSDSQLKSFLNQQFGVNEEAWELLDIDKDGQLSEKEFERVWNWLRIRESARLRGRWMVSGLAWFQLIDSDGDNQLQEAEFSNLVSRLSRYDRNGDGRITPAEMPLVVRLELERSDSRLQNLRQISRTGGSDSDSPEVDDWFAAMDANADGSITQSEFLGNSEDFREYDRNEDGVVTRSEVYTAP